MLVELYNLFIINPKRKFGLSYIDSKKLEIDKVAEIGNNRNSGYSL